MRAWFPIFFMLCAVTATPAQGSPGKLEHVQLFGREYVRLDEWAAANNFEFAWTRKDELAQVKSKSAKLIFEVDSRKAVINGVNVALSVVIARKNGLAHIAPLDLETTIHPLLFPPKNNGGKVQTICLDPGHGGKDPGNKDGVQQEKKYTLLLAQEVEKRLKDAGFNVILTRRTDVFIDLPDRPLAANDRRADLLVSLHFNSLEGGAARGLETYCLTPAHASSSNARGEGASAGNYPGNKFNEKNVLLAWQVQKSVVRSLGVEDRGVKRARFAVLKTPEMPAILVEGGFMSDPAEARRIYDNSWRRKLAQAIVDGIIAYKKQVER